jgi:hypothetical protein
MIKMKPLTVFTINKWNRVWWYTLVVPEPRRLRQPTGQLRLHRKTLSQNTNKKANYKCYKR